MDKPVTLVPLVCSKCDMPVPAQPGEAAWVCRQCGQGWLLDEASGLTPINIHYQAGLPSTTPNKPYWVASGRVTFERQVYGGSTRDVESAAFWGETRYFFIPAFNCPIETLTTLGPRLLLQPPVLQDGLAAVFEPVTLARRDVQSLAELIAVAIEAGRKDHLKKINIQVELSEPVLWILPTY